MHCLAPVEASLVKWRVPNTIGMSSPSPVHAGPGPSCRRLLLRPHHLPNTALRSSWDCASGAGCYRCYDCCRQPDREARLLVSTADLQQPHSLLLLRSPINRYCPLSKPPDVLHSVDAICAASDELSLSGARASDLLDFCADMRGGSTWPPHLTSAANELGPSDDG
jgi:hypothetical protein